MEPIDVEDPDALAALIRRLQASWAESTQRDFPLRRTGKQTEAQLAVVHGLVAHTYVVAVPATDMLLRGETLQAMPLVRVAYECALTAQWVAQTPDGAQALMNSDIRKRRALVGTMQKSAAETFREGAPLVAHQSDEDLPTTSNASALNFEQLCADLRPGGPDAYVYYRILSQMAHASVMVLDSYLDEGGSGRVVFRVHPRQPASPASWLFFVAASLAWAGRAFDYFDRDHLRRRDLRDAAKQLRITLDLQPSHTAWLRQARKP